MEEMARLKRQREAMTAEIDRYNLTTSFFPVQTVVGAAFDGGG